MRIELCGLHISCGQICCNNPISTRKPDRIFGKSNQNKGFQSHLDTSCVCTLYNVHTQFILTVVKIKVELIYSYDLDIVLSFARTKTGQKLMELSSD